MSSCFHFAIQGTKNISFGKISPMIDQEIMNEFIIILSNIQREILEQSMGSSLQGKRRILLLE